MAVTAACKLLQGSVAGINNTRKVSWHVSGEGLQRGQAGAVAAAARELRPVEIVGLYEGQKAALEVHLY